MDEVYIKNLGFITGNAKSLSILAADRDISCDGGFLETEGYKQACIADVCGADMIKRVPFPSSSEFLIYYNTCPHAGCIVNNNGSVKIEEQLDYSAEAYLKYCGCDDASYIGLSQQGCTGLLSSIDIAYMKIRLGRSKSVFCICDDVLPHGSFHDISSGKMLLSDTVSYTEITSVPSDYAILNILEKSVIGKSFLQIAACTEKLLSDLCRSFTELKDLENIIFPNHWRGTWNSFIHHNRLECRFEECTIGTYAHGLSADVVSNILLYQQNGWFTKGKKQAVVSYGYGGHLRAMLFEAV